MAGAKYSSSNICIRRKLKMNSLYIVAAFQLDAFSTRQEIFRDVFVTSKSCQKKMISSGYGVCFRLEETPSTMELVCGTCRQVLSITKNLLDAAQR